MKPPGSQVISRRNESCLDKRVAALPHQTIFEIEPLHHPNFKADRARQNGICGTRGESSVDRLGLTRSGGRVRGALEYTFRLLRDLEPSSVAAIILLTSTKMAPITDDAVEELKSLVRKLENRVHELEGRFTGGQSSGSSPASSSQTMRMIIMGPPGAGSSARHCRSL